MDGRNRYRACELAELDLEPDDITQYEGNDPLGFVVSKNLHRRHLNESQRAQIAADIANMPQGFRSDQPSANLQKVISVPKAAELMNVSPRSVETAKKIKAPDLKAAVKTGRKSVNAAAKEQKARGTTKKGNATITDKTRAAATKRKRQEFWAEFPQTCLTKLWPRPKQLLIGSRLTQRTAPKRVTGTRSRVNFQKKLNSCMTCLMGPSDQATLGGRYWVDGCLVAPSSYAATDRLSR